MKSALDFNDDMILSEIKDLKSLAKEIPKVLNSNNSAHLDNLINSYSK
jgi:hypothetical protein